MSRKLVYIVDYDTRTNCGAVWFLTYDEAKDFAIKQIGKEDAHVTIYKDGIRIWEDGSET